MPARLRPSAPPAPDAILVGDPGRALALAQLLIEKPKMSNHARGLWGYTGATPAGRPLTVQATGMGAPSAAIVLEDLAELGVRRVIRIGTCTGAERRAELGEILVPDRVWAGDSLTFSLDESPLVEPDPVLHGRLAGSGRVVTTASRDRLGAPSSRAAAGDLQTAAVLALARWFELPAAALLIVERVDDGVPLDDEAMASRVQAAGEAAADALST